MPNSIQSIDESILFFIQSHIKSPALDQVMVFITSLGNAGLIWITIAFVLLLIKRYQKCGVCLLCAVALATHLGEDFLKPFFERVRPCNAFLNVVLLIHRPHTSSFPSGHTMVGFASATVLYYYNRSLGIIAYILAAAIAFSRLYLFVHYPTDILGGILFGVLSSSVLIYGLNKLYRNLETKLPHAD
jgi:undecaprenyl-diphosphatase